jgi:hypothetical protein
MICGTAGEPIIMQVPENKPENPWGESAPVKLLRDGWKPHCFPNSTVLVALPPGVSVQFDDKGVLHGFARGPGRFFTATLHTNPKFTQSRDLALEFVANLARKKGAEPVDVATYRYFIDPKEGREGSRIITFCVIGIPGAVVVVTLSREPDSPPSEQVESIRRAIPQIIGELV